MTIFSKSELIYSDSEKGAKPEASKRESAQEGLDDKSLRSLEELLDLTPEQAEKMYNSLPMVFGDDSLEVSTEQQLQAFEADYALDEEDSEYLKAVASPKAQKGTKSCFVTSQKRNASVAAELIKKTQYQCQIDNKHTSFISGSSGRQYMEVHHIIPISKTEEFQYSLDIHPNMAVLCPNCHRSVHFGTQEVKSQLLKQLYNERKQFLSDAGINVSLKKLYEYYGINTDEMNVKE